LATPEYRKRFVKEILKNDRIIELMKNKYGNFVILKVIQTAEPEDKTLVMQSLLKNVNSVNTTKYKNRWIQFIEENPMKVPGFNPSQPVKPSLFKHAPHNSSNPASDDNLSRDSDDMGWNGDEWNDMRQEGKKKFPKNPKEEKSHFFYTSNKPNMGNYPVEYEGEERFGFNIIQQHHPENVSYSSSPGLRGQNLGGGYNKNNNKNNQKQNMNHPNNQRQQFMEKPQPQPQGNNPNKWGYNSFY